MAKADAGRAQAQRQSSGPAQDETQSGKPHRAGQRFGTLVPAPLALLLLVVLIVGVTWALFLPPWQAPDENSHFAYAQTLAENHRLPGSTGRIFSTEQEIAASQSNADQTAAQLAVKPEWSPQAYHRWRVEESRLGSGARTDGGGPLASSSNPPLYYASAP